MDLLQFSITFLIAFVLGVTLTLLSETIKGKVSKFYKTWFFRHKILIPYDPKDNYSLNNSSNKREK